MRLVAVVLSPVLSLNVGGSVPDQRPLDRRSPQHMKNLDLLLFSDGPRFGRTASAERPFHAHGGDVTCSADLLDCRTHEGGVCSAPVLAFAGRGEVRAFDC